MTRSRFLSLLLLPFSLVFGLIIILRDGLYRYGVLKSVKFNMPVIGIGNLSLGGAGKTPHVEYLIRLLNPYLELGIMSRGYKRKTKGFKKVGPGDDALSVGDEPMQYHLKFKDAFVAVSESRSLGIPLLLQLHPQIQVILLDDSYQHRSVDPGLNILLTEFDHPYNQDFILPAGRLREWRSGADRADMVIVTKCPEGLDESIIPKWRENLDLKSSQRLFFSKYEYARPYNLFTAARADLNRFDNVLLLCAIANESYLLSHLERLGVSVNTMIYEDHHYYTPHEISLVKMTFDNMPKGNNAILTTEKDATRLFLHKEFLLVESLPIFVLPARVTFLFEQGSLFDEEVKRFLLNFKS